MPDDATENEPHWVTYPIEHTYGIYHLRSDDLTAPPEDRTYFEESRVTPTGWTADSEGTHVERAHLDCDDVSLEELKFEFQNHHTVILRPEKVPGEVEAMPPAMTADELGYQFAIRPDEREKLGDVEPAYEADATATSGDTE